MTDAEFRAAIMEVVARKITSTEEREAYSPPKKDVQLDAMLEALANKQRQRRESGCDQCKHPDNKCVHTCQKAFALRDSANGRKCNCGCHSLAGYAATVSCACCSQTYTGGKAVPR